MQPPFQLNVGQIPFEKLYQYLVPVIPGFMLLLALVLGQPAWFVRASAELGLTGFAMATILLCTSYACGFILHFVSLGIISTLSTSIFPSVLNKACKMKLLARPKRENLNFSGNPAWREVAGLFLGDLAPPPPATPNDLKAHDLQWKEWYNVLQEYVLNKPIITDKSWATLGALQASGWGLLIASLYIPALGGGHL